MRIGPRCRVVKIRGMVLHSYIFIVCFRSMLIFISCIVRGFVLRIYTLQKVYDRKDSGVYLLYNMHV